MQLRVDEQRYRGARSALDEFATHGQDEHPGRGCSSRHCCLDVQTTAMALFRTAGPSYSTAAHLSYLHQTHQAPEEAAVFLGHYGQPTEILIDGFSQRFDLAPATQAQSHNPHGALAGEILKLRMGPLFVMCLVGSAGQTFVKGAAFQQGFDDRLISIWPQRSIRDPSWHPPKSVLSDGEWKSLTRIVTNLAND